MKYIRFFIPAIFALFSSSPPAYPEISPRPQTPRPYGMGNAFGAVANDLNSIFFNPAGLSLLNQIEAAGIGGRTFSGNGSPYTQLMAAGTLPLKYYSDSWIKGNFGYALRRSQGSGNDAITDVGISAGSNPDDFLPRKWVPFKFPPGLHTGLTIRARQINRIPGNSSFGLGMDMGFLYQFEESVKNYKNGWTVGLAIQDMNTASISTPVLWRLASAWRGPWYTFAMDMVSQAGVTKFFPGVEASFFKKLLLLRMGSWDLPGRPRQLVLGVGTLLPPIQLDLAYGFPLSEFDKSNDQILVAFTYRFGTPFLAQYIQDENQKRSAEIENRFVSLEFKRASLEADIRNKKELYEKVDADFKKIKSRSALSEKELKSAEEKIAKQKEEVEKLKKEIAALQAQKGEIDNSLKAGQGPKAAGPARRHKVVRGDTLRSIAEKYYGTPEKWELIYQANQERIIRGVPKTGEELVIP